MWCDRCQQDVPGVASTDGRQFCCPRCGGVLRAGVSGPAGDVTADSTKPAAAQPGVAEPACDGWELDEQLRHIGRVLDTGKVGGRRSESACQQELARLDPPYAGPAARHVPPVRKSTRTIRPNASQSHSTLAALCWAVLSLGTMAFVCGGILLGWSVVTGREELWTVGLPVALAGQVALLVGLIMQLDRLWHNSRDATAKLDEVDQQLHELKTTTSLLGATHSSPTTAFYYHLADGAGPQLLLSDLKSQLDLLALKMGEREC